jgi:hypothetical protein
MTYAAMFATAGDLSASLVDQATESVAQAKAEGDQFAFHASNLDPVEGKKCEAVQWLIDGCPGTRSES